MPTLPHIYLFLAASLVMGLLHRRISSSGSIFAVLYCLPFTIMHELSHYVVALITGGRPSSFSVWPQRVGRTWLLGSVSAEPTLLSAAPTALAPLGWLILGFFIFTSWPALSVRFPGYLIVLALYACSAACTPSWQDYKVALTHPFSLLLWAGGAYIAYLLWS